MDFTSDFQPRQIVCLEHEGTCLYAEVIQVVISRQLCWVRPLLLGALPSNCLSVDESLPPLTDLRSCADLLWPIALFRAALDTEVIPLLVTLLASPQGNTCGSSGTAYEGEALSIALPTDLEFDSRLRNGLLCDSSPAAAGAPKAASQPAVPSAPGGCLRADDKGVDCIDLNVLLDSRAQAQSERDPGANRQLDVPPEAAPWLASSKLNQFIYEVWQADKGAFCSNRHRSPAI